MHTGLGRRAFASRSRTRSGGGSEDHCRVAMTTFAASTSAMPVPHIRMVRLKRFTTSRDPMNIALKCHQLLGSSRAWNYGRTTSFSRYPRPRAVSIEQERGVSLDRSVTLLYHRGRKLPNLAISPLSVRNGNMIRIPPLLPSGWQPVISQRLLVAQWNPKRSQVKRFYPRGGT
jgi:hypothetical protein